MASLQERLQLKRVPLDTWNIREQLSLASAVVRSGDQNWMTVSRSVKTIGEPNRPPDWYSQKSCAAQYGALLEHVETPKRKKRSSEGAGDTPQESIVKRLTHDRIAEIQKTIAEMNQQYEHLKTEIMEVRNPSTSEDRLREIWLNIEATKRTTERETTRRAAWLKEREERRARVARESRGSVSTAPTSPSAAAPASSPLLTSLLKSSPVVTTPQHMPHPASVVDTVSPSVTAPTLSMLLENTSPHQDTKRQAIEHIKSQLVQIEHQLKANTPPPPALLAAAPAPALDIDDIEINAEDVYVFRDVDIHIPTVTHDKPIEKPLIPKIEEEEQVEIEVDAMPQPELEETQLEKAEQEPIIEIKEEVPVEFETENIEQTDQTVAVEENPAEFQLAFPEVKFPTPEIKVIQPDVQKIKEESDRKEVESPEIPEQQEVQDEIVVEERVVEKTVEEALSDLHAEPEDISNILEPRPPSPPPVVEEITTTEVIETENIPLPPEPDVTEKPPTPIPETEVPPDPESTPEVKEERPEVEPEATVLPVTDEKTEELKKDEDEVSNDSLPLKQMIRSEALRTIRDDTHTETDDDTPMELSREEEKDGKKRRDYSRKKKPDSRTCSGSESATEASAPESPSTSEATRHHRLWKKSVMLVYTRLCAHKYASLFLRPITDDEAPGYSAVVKRPMDLSTIRRNIENGIVRTTAEFQRDVLLMLSNALMYNHSEHSVYAMAKEMHEEATCQLGMLLAAQAHAGLVEVPPSRRKRRHQDSPRVYTKRQH